MDVAKPIVQGRIQRGGGPGDQDPLLLGDPKTSKRGENVAGVSTLQLAGPPPPLLSEILYPPLIVHILLEVFGSVGALGGEGVMLTDTRGISNYLFI